MVVCVLLNSGLEKTCLHLSQLSILLFKYIGAVVILVEVLNREHESKKMSMKVNPMVGLSQLIKRI